MSRFKSFFMGMADTLEAYPKLIQPLPDRYATPAQIAHRTRAAKAVHVDRRVFIVHGHDEPNTLRLENLLHRLGLVPIKLLNEAGQGQTTAEKFEREAKSAEYAVVLFTPDDYVQLDDASGYWQARPNVIFELGWFHGWLERSRICLVRQKDTYIHSDFHGVGYIAFEDSVDEVALEIERELRVAGLIAQTY